MGMKNPLSHDDLIQDTAALRREVHDRAAGLSDSTRAFKAEMAALSGETADRIQQSRTLLCRISRGDCTQ